MNNGMLSLFANMPMSTRFSLGLVGGGAVGYFVYELFGTTGVMLLLLGSLVVGLILLAYGFLLSRMEKKKAAGFSEEMKGQSAAAPTSISKAEQLAKLDDLRKRFDDGVDKFRQAGKNIYSLPWYMLIGEPGSGKTEAIRHSSIGFPPGLQDELQGVGGTINMNWWFTNNAVILDLAGRLVFSEVETGTSNEWATFLKLLKTQRQNCPVNGMLLVIPADSLIKDSPEVIHRKAYKISQQLNMVQRTLDIRFPVFIVVTKSDLVTGFREFFDSLHTPESQQQILGWSNPNSIDDPFKPEMTDEYLKIVQDRLLRRRLAIMRDPTPSHDLSDSRFDEVDTLFDFPSSFDKISGPLKQYLQLVFVPSEWASKPLFLRGIYFTSSMQEGVALDAELAKVLGISVDKIPEGKIWERERSFFLRDTFLSKIFLERGLVTRATNVRKQHLRRKMALLGAAAGGLLLLFGLTWMGGYSLEKSIGGERKLWVYAADELTAGRSLAIVAPRPGTSSYDYMGSKTVRLEGLQKPTLAEFHEDLNQRVKKDIMIPAIFRLSKPFDRSLNQQRRQARCVVFENSILKPVVVGVRERMAGNAVAWSPDATAALGGLIRIEAGAVKWDYDPKDRLVERVDVDALLRYLLGPAGDLPKYTAPDRAAYEQALAWCYDIGKDGGGQAWPPAWLTNGIELNANVPIDKGSAAFVDYCVRSANSVEAQLAKIRALWEDLDAFRRDAERRYRQSETDFLHLFEVNLDKLISLQGFVAIEREWRVRYDQLSKDLENLRRVFALLERRYQEIPLCQGADVAAAYRLAITNSLQEIQGAFASLPLPREGAATVTAAAARAREGTLVIAIQLRMQIALRSLQAEFQRKLERDLEEFGRMYAGRKAQVSGFNTRFPLYEPVVIPESLKIKPLAWRAFQERFRGMDVTDVHRELEKVCKKIEQVFTGYGQVMTNVPRQQIDGLIRRSRIGVDKVYSEAFFRDASEVVKAWSGLRGAAGSDREALLAVVIDDFKRNYVVNSLETQEDYVAQYWSDLIYLALVSLADEIQPEIDAILAQLRPYARFPLDVPRRVDRDLTVNELLEAKALLGKLVTLRTAGEGKTIGEGENTGVRRVDAQLDRLRNLQLGDMVAWVKAASAVAAALPPDPKRAYVCRVSIIPAQDQYRLLQDINLTPADSSLPVWRIVDMGQQKRQDVDKFRTEQAAIKTLGELSYPGGPISFRFYHYWGDPRDPQPEPSRTVNYLGLWSVLRMLHNSSAKPVAGDPLKWIVPITLEDEKKAERVFWVQLEFEKALPVVEKWPKRPAAFNTP